MPFTTITEPSTSTFNARRPSELLLRRKETNNENESFETSDLGFLSSPTAEPNSANVSPSSELPNYEESTLDSQGTIRKHFNESSTLDSSRDTDDDGDNDEEMGDVDGEGSESDNPNDSDNNSSVEESNSSSSSPSSPVSTLPLGSGTTTTSTRPTNPSNSSINSGTNANTTDSDQPSTLRASHVSLLGGKYLLFLNPQGPGTSTTDSTTATPATTTPNLSAPRTIQKCVNVETREQFMCKILPRTATGLGLLATYHRLSDYSDLVTPLHEVIMGPKLFYLIFPPSYGNVHAYLLAKKRLREEEAARLFKQMVRAVEYCHSKGIVLRDLKLGKFVFVDKTRATIRLESLEDAVLLENETDDGLNDKHGCPNYVSPEKAEILRSSSRRYPGKATDIWGLGIMLYTMLVGRYPFNDVDHSKLFAKIRRGNFNIPEQISPSAKCLIRCLLRKEPGKRLTLREIRKHPWILGSDKNGIRTFGSTVGSCGTQFNVEHNPQPQITSTGNAFNQQTSQMDSSNDDQVVPEFMGA